MDETGWQDISTAPKDGNPLLAISTGTEYPPMHAIVAWGCLTHMFSSAHQCTRHPSSDCRFEWLGERAARYGVPFTHWLPLPSPPSQEGTT